MVTGKQPSVGQEVGLEPGCQVRVEFRESEAGRELFTGGTKYCPSRWTVRLEGTSEARGGRSDVAMSLEAVL